MRKIFLASALLLIVGFVISCSKSNNGGGGPSVDCSAVANKSFSADVNPIIQASCNISGCHAAGSGNGPGPLTNYTQVFNARTNIRSAVSTGLMPQGSSLTAAQKNSIVCWIDSGAPNN
jgi:hypothetical protein